MPGEHTISSFSGPRRFLSNFYPAMIEFDGGMYPTVEHAYQAAKTLFIDERLAIQDCHSPGQAKRKGRKVTLRSDWEEIKLDIMQQLVKAKFVDPKLRMLLLHTGEAELIEGNHWHDTFWGICNGVGENHLGKILMRIRDEICAE